MVNERQARQKQQHDKEFFIGQEVTAKNLRPGPRFVPGVVIQKHGPLSYVVEVKDGVLWWRQVDLLKQIEPRRARDLVTVEVAKPETQEDTFPYVPSTPEIVSPNRLGTGIARPNIQPRTQPQRKIPNWYGKVVTH
jgi:hypothetical protein